MSDTAPYNAPYRERRPINRVSAYGGTLEAQRVAEHEHPEIQFVAGLGTDTIEAAWHSDGGRRGHGILHDGDIAIIASGQPHTFAWRATATVSCVYVDPQELDDMRQAVDSPFSGAITSCFGFSDPLAREIIIALGREAANDLPLGRVYAESLEQSLLLGALGRGRSPAKPHAARPSLLPHRLASVLDFIEDHFTRDIGLAELAEAAGMSRFHFSRAFKIATGWSPCRYVNDKRIREAKRLLATDLPLCEIATAMGFADQSHFTARFRVAVGMPPSAFRKAGLAQTQ